MTTKLGSVYRHPGLGRAIREVVLTMAALFGSLALLGLCAEAASGEDAVVTAGPVVATELPTCPFSPGWNLTVLHGTPDLLPECISYVARWEGAFLSQMYQRSSAYWNDLTEFDITKGYWAWRTQ